MNKNQEAILALLNKAYKEGQDKGYTQGCSDTLTNLGVHAATEEQAEEDGIPTHNIVNPIVRAYFDSLPEGGYSQTDVSRMWYFTKYVSESSKKNMADRGNPFLVFCNGGDSLILTCQGEKPQAILPNNNVYECYLLLPNKTYQWRVMKGDNIIKEGAFKTVGDFHLVNMPTWPNVRDIAYTPTMKAGLVYSGANPDNVVVDSDDHEIIKYLGIDTQLNLRTAKAGSNTDKAWRPDLFKYGYNINIADYSSLFKSTAGFKKAFETLVSELKKGRKVAFNCFAGADRTGTFRYVIQGVCCVPKRIAQGFYELTSLMYWLNTKMWDDTGGEDDFRRFDADLEKKFGPDLYTQCYKLLTEVVKVAPQTIRELQELLMVDPSIVPQL